MVFKKSFFRSNPQPVTKSLFDSRYEVLDILINVYGKAVIKAYDWKRKRFVALKTRTFDSPSMILNDDFLRRWRRMIKYGKKLHHSNILPILDDGLDSIRHQIYYTTYYIPGYHLGDYDFIKNFSFDERLSIAIDAAKALHYAHSKMIIHRDIKPQNILIDYNGKAYLTDFGSARFELDPITKSGTTLGTPKYMSPEQIRGEKLDWRSDIFSLGTVYYMLFTGRFPFEGKNSYEISYHIIHGDKPTSPVRYDSSLPEDISDIILAMLKKDLDDRIVDLSEMIGIMEKYKTNRN